MYYLKKTPFSWVCLSLVTERDQCVGLGGRRSDCEKGDLPEVVVVMSRGSVVPL